MYDNVTIGGRVSASNVGWSVYKNIFTKNDTYTIANISSDPYPGGIYMVQANAYVGRDRGAMIFVWKYNSIYYSSKTNLWGYNTDVGITTDGLFQMTSYNQGGGDGYDCYVTKISTL